MTDSEVPPVEGSQSQPSVLGDPMEAWKERGRELNELYDALVAVVDEPAPGMDPVADLKALGAQRDRLRAENKRLRDANRLSGVLRDHYLAGIVCDHERKADNPMCACSGVDLGWHPSVGAAVDAWVAHVLAALAAGSQAKGNE